MIDPATHPAPLRPVLPEGISSDDIYQAVRKVLVQAKLKGDLLDFGAGTGSVISAIADLCYQGAVTGADLRDRPDSIPSNVVWVQCDLNNPVPLPAASFDVIVSTEVIEHLENPRAVFREFQRLLRQGGTLLLTTPNQESIRSLAGLIFGGHFVGFLNTYPEHITALLKKDFERICQETGFSAPAFSYTSWGGVPKFPQVSWQAISFGLLRGRLFSDNMLLLCTKL